MDSNKVDLQVCVTCLGENKEKLGAEFFAALESQVDCEKINLQPVECFAVCKRQCMVTVSQAGKWLYLIGDLDIKDGIPALFDYIEAYADSDYGTPSLSKRPKIIRKGTIARMPAKENPHPDPLPEGEGEEGNNF